MTAGPRPHDHRAEALCAIHGLLCSYIACVDAADATGTAQLFLPDGSLVSHVMGTTCTGRAAINKYILSLRNSWTTIRIHLALPHVEILDETTAIASSYFVVYGERGADHWGLYTDRLRGEGGRWQFEVREITLQGAARYSERMVHR